jgi:DNA-directed RNA polymerase specialized sigma24 family protein
MTEPLPRRSLTPESWDDLFDFLDPDRRGKKGANRDREAESRHREIARRLTCFFASRGCAEADDLAVETVLRVAARCRELPSSDYSGRLAYFYAVARHVLQECQHDSRRDSTRRELLHSEPALAWLRGPQLARSDELLHRCLDECVSSLPRRARALILEYYKADHAARIEGHRRLALEFGKSVNALRIEVHRIRNLLRSCVSDCVHPDTQLRADLA